MYKLTPRMLQKFESDLKKYHQLFQAGRCLGWEQEELIVNAIKSDTQAQDHVLWREGGHDADADISVREHLKNISHPIQIKSGKATRKAVNISGHRLGRFEENFADITNYLNSNSAQIISVRHKKIDDSAGRAHIYQLCYLDVTHLTGITEGNWERVGKQYKQTNTVGVEFSLRPKMSWQIWWKVPLELFSETPEIRIN